MVEQGLYNVLARYYDVLYRDYLERAVPRLVDAYVSVFQKYAMRRVERVLDLGCGTGGPSLELAARGYRVVGVDINREVVEIAREKASKKGLEVECVEGDARRVDELFPEEGFDAVTMFFTTIAYMVERRDVERLLSAVRKVLAPGGVFVADYSNPYYFLYRLGERGENKPATWTASGEGEDIVVIDWNEVVDWANGVVRLNRLLVFASGENAGRVFLVTDTLRLHSPLELVLEAELLGYRSARTLCYTRGALSERGGDGCSRVFFVAVK